MENMNLTTNTTAPAVIDEKPLCTVDVDQALQEWEAYQKITSKMLDETDYQDIKGKAYKKKSAWRKYARAFNISDEIIEKEIIKNDKGRVIEASFLVKAILPNGRYAEGWGNCSRWEGNKAHPNHDIPTTAHTRAKNRAIADLIGAGEVSAEEIQAEVNFQAKQNAKAKIQRKPEPKAKPKYEIPPKEVIEVQVVKDDPVPKPLDTAKDIASSIVAELPPNNTNLLFAKMELKKLIDSRIVSKEESEQVLKELEGMF